MAIPPGQCGHIHFSPPLPYAKKQLFECAPQGNLIKCVITYKDAFWRNKGMAGQVLSTGAATDNAKGVCFSISFLSESYELILAYGP